MANLLQVQDGSKAYGSKVLFEDATFSVSEGEHVGVIGPNGAGKTTLFKALIGQETLDSGEIIRSRQLRLGYLSQHDTWRQDETVDEFLSKDAVIPLWTLKQLAVGLGLTNDHFSVAISSLSGGYRMRIKLLYLIGQDPNLMLLDEPTNYLDLETLVVLENFLQGYEGAFLLISHDREFLRRTTTQTLEIESGEINKYPGNIDDYFEQKALLREQLEAQARSASEKRQEILDFVARFGAKATKASQAQSRLKSLDRMESIELKALPVRARIRIPEPARTGKQIFDLRKVSMGYESRTIIDSASLLVTSGDHIAVVGFNGAGKSTLLKTLAREIEPLSGSLEYGYQVTVGYYAQHVSERLNLDLTVLQALEQNAHESVVRQDALDLAGSLLFSGSDVYKKLTVLSGGERARVALGQILLQKASCLILDEPTNHLDFDTVEAMTQALVDYPGTVIVVSHDRSFVRRIGTKILEIDHGELSLYLGTYDDYVWRVQKQMLSQSAAPSKTKAPVAAQPTAVQKPASEVSSNVQYREAKKALDRELKQLEKQITVCETKIETFTQEIRRVKELIAKSSENEAFLAVEKLNALQIEIHPFEEEWVTLNEKREQVQNQVRELMRENC